MSIAGAAKAGRGSNQGGLCAWLLSPQLSSSISSFIVSCLPCHMLASRASEVLTSSDKALALLASKWLAWRGHRESAEREGLSVRCFSQHCVLSQERGRALGHQRGMRQRVAESRQRARFLKWHASQARARRAGGAAGGKRKAVAELPTAIAVNDLSSDADQH